MQAYHRLSDRYQVSREATGQAFITYRHEPSALIVVHEKRVLRIYRNIKCPYLTIAKNAPIEECNRDRRR
jgi:hypothetical protein